MFKFIIILIAVCLALLITMGVFLFYELLAAMEVGHEKRLDAFHSLTQSRQTE